MPMFLEAATQIGFSSEQITSITSSLNAAITGTLNMFVSLLPVVALISGAAFGIHYVKGLFGQTKKQ